MHVCVGFGYGNHDDASFVLKKKISLNRGNNTLDVLSMIIGLQVFLSFFLFVLFFLFGRLFILFDNMRNDINMICM